MNAYRKEGVCPCCGRFSGGVDRCEYCDSDLPWRSLQSICRQLIAVTAVLGLLFLWISSRGPQVRTIRAADIGPAMNHALIRVKGVIASPPYINTAQGEVSYASFLIEDEGANVRVCLKGEEAARFAGSTTARREGAVIEAVGVARVRAGREPRVFACSAGEEQAWKLIQ